MTVQVLLSTYNGERYLRRQLDSFLDLVGADIKILVRDDGSTDATRDILAEYRDKFGFEVIFGDNVGLNRSMYELVYARDRECDAFAFADQDDIWLQDKLKRAISMISGIEGPALYAGSSHLTDEALNVIGRTRIPRKPLSFYNAMVENVCIGHTMVLNRELMDIYADSYTEGIFVFDYWAYLIASAFGKVVYDSEPMALYRQHGDNAIGYKHSLIGSLKMRIRRVLTGKSYYNARQLHAFLIHFGDKIPEEYRTEAERFFRSERNFFTRLGYAFMTRAYRQGRAEGIIFRTMYVFNRYNFKKYNLTQNKKEDKK